jgi:hypothetical protein
MGQLVFQGAAGGQVALVGPNPSTSFALNLPAINGNLITSGDTGTVTNTMLASNIYTAPGTIGSVTPNTGAFTTLSASSTVSGIGFSNYLASPPAIGGIAANTGTFTTIALGGNTQNQKLGAGDASIMKNRIINGAMVIDQRNAGASVTPTPTEAFDYTLDRWAVEISQASKISVQQNAGSITPPAGFSNYLGITSLATTSVGAGDYFILRQAIEGYNIADLGWGTANAKTVTLSFQVYSSLTGTFGASLTNSTQGYSNPFTYSIPVANTWTSVSVTIAGPTGGSWNITNGAGIGVQFSLGVGSTYIGAAGSWSSNVYLSATGATSVVGTNGATFYITGVQLEVGSSATGFEYRQYGQELALCQRYGYKIPDTFLSYVFNGALLLTGLRLHPITMRATPTLSGSATYTVNTGSAGTVAIADATTYGIQFYNSSSNWSTSPVAGVSMQGAFLTAEL